MDTLITDIIVLCICLMICIWNDFVAHNKRDNKCFWTIVVILIGYLIYIYV